MSPVFTPHRPLRESRIFAGRSDERNIFLNALSSFGRQIVVFGSRGVGKTSFVNVLLKNDKGRLDIQCEENDSLETLSEKILNRVEELSTVKVEANSSGRSANVGLGGMIGGNIESSTQTSITKNITLGKNVDSIVFALEGLENKGKDFRIVFDEVDKIVEAQTKLDLARLVKAFSDRLQKTKIIFVGVAETVKDLLELHPSNTRSLLDIELKPMKRGELKDILTKAESDLPFTFAIGLKEKIVTIAEGLPFFVHLLGEGIEIVYRREGGIAQENEFDNYAIPHAYQNANHSLKDKYEKIAKKSKIQKYVLWAVSENLASEVSKKDIDLNYEKITGEKIIPQTLQSPITALLRENIIERWTKGFYKFKDPMFKIYCNIARRKEPVQQSFFPS